MRTSAELKGMARRALQGNYGSASGAVLVMYLVGILMMMPVFIVIVFVGVVSGTDNGGTAAVVWFMAAAMLAYMVFALVMRAGYARLCYRIAIGERGEISNLFFAVKNHFARYFGLMLLLLLYGILATLPGILTVFLFAAGGNTGLGFFLGYILILAIPIAVLCRYAMALFALVENPQLRVREAMQFSKELMRGNIWRMIRLELSFCGIFLLGYATMGIGGIWIAPYLTCTNVLFYLTIKEEKYPPVRRSAEEEAMEARYQQVMPELSELPGQG